MTLPLYERWKSSETKAVADLAREHDWAAWGRLGRSDLGLL